jgi:ATP-dependent Lhr-like helicase
MRLEYFHPAVKAWFEKAFNQPTEPQELAWPSIKSGRHTLIAAPTGSGKTLAAFLAAIDDLVRLGIEEKLSDQTYVVYVSPLKALSNDIHRNLEEPLEGIRDQLSRVGLPDINIRTFVRTGDTPQKDRNAMRRRAPHIVVTTPESLYILLNSESGRQMLSTVRTVIVDEIHAIAGSKRGSHLALSMERLAGVTDEKPTRIGLSATQKPIEEVARFLTGNRDDECRIIDAGHIRRRDLAVELPRSPLEPVMSNEVWNDVYDRLAELTNEHRTTLIFVNTRRWAERVTRHLSERIGEDKVTSHHGSLSREHRLNAEQRLKNGELRALVATASLELGIDIGDIELVCQLGSTRSIAAFLQRVGRSGHSLGGTPKGRLFPLSRDDLVECTALLDATRRGELDRLILPDQPLDVLAQQIIAEAAAQEWQEDALYESFRHAYPYRCLRRKDFDDVVAMLTEGYSTRRGRRHAYIHRDAVNKKLRGRRGARLAAITSGGTIPDNGDFDVVLEPAGLRIGTVNEDFAIESLAGDIFQLGNNSYRILRIETGSVRVEDAHGQPPTIPFWFGEAPARTDELSKAVSRLREEISQRLSSGNMAIDDATDWLVSEVGITTSAAQQLVEYLASALAALSALPTHNTIVMERFFDEAGNMHLVIHSPYGSRVNRAWGLALRKRFCRKFNFELQAAAVEDAIVLSLGPTHSFPLEEVARYLNSKTVREILIQALLAAPMFNVRWRWNASIALAVLRFRAGKRVLPQFQRMNAEDLVAVVFPDQLACFENLAGDREVPDHPLVNQTMKDCLDEAMDITAFEALLASIERGEVQVIARDLIEPSPLAQEILNARPYAFLDDAPLEERRTQAIMSRRWIDTETAADLGKLDSQAIERVREEAWPDVTNADELHEALMLLGFLTEQEVRQEAGWRKFLDDLIKERRATRVAIRPANNLNADVGSLVAAAERLPQLLAVFSQASLTPPIKVPEEYAIRHWETTDALIELVRGRLEGSGPVTAERLANLVSLPQKQIDSALLSLESEGFAMRGRFTPDAKTEEWCERGLLARIHRYTLNRLRREIEPVSSADFMRFLFAWQRVTPEHHGEGPDALAAVVEQLEGFEAPAAAWENDILAVRLSDYRPDWLDNLCLSGRILWTRLTPPKLNTDKERSSGPIRSTPIALTPRSNFRLWEEAFSHARHYQPALSTRSGKALEHLKNRGASFFSDIVDATGLLRSQVEEALGELVVWGLVNSDSFNGLRALLVPSQRRRPLSGGRRRGRVAAYGVEDAGRWVVLNRQFADETNGETPKSGLAREHLEHIAWSLLRRYGVVFRKLLEREPKLPPWRDLLTTFRRMEARGEVRGGRFVDGFSGEQFALPEAVGSLREARRKAKDGTCISISGADPLNLVGVITPGGRIPALAGNRVLFRDGVPIAAKIGGEVRFLEKIDKQLEWETRNQLLRRNIPPELRPYLSRVV